MFNSQSFDEIAARISKAIENSPAKDVEKNVKAMLASGLARLDLVPRAEFDLQGEVLRKTREKLEAALQFAKPRPIRTSRGRHRPNGRVRR